jgi:hypothetical protein
MISDCRQKCKCRSHLRQSADGEGFDSTADSQGNSLVPPAGEAKAEAVSPDSSTADTDLARLIAAWPAMPADVRAAILAMVR